MGWRRVAMVCMALSACAKSSVKPSATEACLITVEAQHLVANLLCETAWLETGDVKVAVAGATIALIHDDAAILRRWAARVPPTIEGARVLHFWGQLQSKRGELEQAEATLRRALALRLDHDPSRATNTALLLIEIVRSSQPAEQTVALARVAWEQAERSKNPQSKVLAATTLVKIFVELGELRTAQAIAADLDTTGPDGSAELKETYQKSRDLVQSILHAARGRHELAAALLVRASATLRVYEQWLLYLDAVIELVPSLLALGRIQEARTAIDEAEDAVSKHDATVTIDIECRLAAVQATIALAEGKLTRALAAVHRGLATPSRDGARVLLLNAHGDVLAQQGDSDGAEEAWHEAADLLETWRASIPTVQLRAGMIAQHRHALESWLESTAVRGDVDGALEVTRRLIGRSLLDRIGQREANASTVDASIRDVEKRLVIRRELGITLGSMRDLRDAPHDFVVIMCGSRSVWAIRKAGEHRSIERVGGREEVIRLVDEFRRNIGDRRVAEQLGTAMFPVSSLPQHGAPIVAVLDRELADIPLAGLRSGGRYLVEHAPILELVAPDLLFVSLVARQWQPAVSLGDPMGDLPGAAREARVVAAMLSTRAHVGQVATRDLVASTAGSRVMHVATHSKVQDGRAVLVLHGGTLSSIDIVTQKIAPRLAVIATCRSQAGDDPSTSLVAAFLAAGSMGVIGAKRSVDDTATTDFVETFYRAGGAVDPIRGLASAQRAAIAAGHPPQKWATFSFFGVGGWLQTQRGDR